MMFLFLPISLMESSSYEMHYFFHSNYSITLLKPLKRNNFNDISRNGRVFFKLIIFFLYNSAVSDTKLFLENYKFFQ